MAVSTNTRGRRAFTCGFGPGHHAHPTATFAIAQSSPIIVRIADRIGSTVVVVHEDGARSEWWHHDWWALTDAVNHSDGIAFLHGDAVLRVGGRLLSVSRTPTPCDDGTAHLDPHHPAWAGPTPRDPVPFVKNPKFSRHNEPGHGLPFWRLETALSRGPGVIIDRVHVYDDGVVVLEYGAERLRRFNHNPQRIRAALAEAIDGTPYRYPPGGYTLAPHPDVTVGDTEYGEAPVASLLDGEVLRVGDCYFWLGVCTSPLARCITIAGSPGEQYFRQKHMAMHLGIQHVPAPQEAVLLTEIARREVRLDPWLDHVSRREQPKIDADDEASTSTTERPTGFLVPIGSDASTEEGRGRLAAAITAAARSMFSGESHFHYPEFALYGPPIVQ